MTDKPLRLFIAAFIGIIIGAVTLAVIRHFEHKPGVYIRGPKIELRLDE